MMGSTVLAVDFSALSTLQVSHSRNQSSSPATPVPSMWDPFPGTSQELHPPCSALGTPDSRLYPELLSHWALTGFRSGTD